MKRFMKVDAVAYGGKDYTFHLDVSLLTEIHVSEPDVDDDIPEGTVEISIKGSRYEKGFLFRGTEEDFMNKVNQHLLAVIVPVARNTNAGR